MKLTFDIVREERSNHPCLFIISIIFSKHNKRNELRFASMKKVQHMQTKKAQQQQIEHEKVKTTLQCPLRSKVWLIKLLFVYLSAQNKRLTLPEVASGIDIEKGGTFKACPSNNLVRIILIQFLHRKGWGIRIT